MVARIRSIDIFRGLTMLVMIFVNDVAGVKGLPAWTYHMPPGKNGMTYVDVVFPTFLFIVGLSIPLAIRNRLKQSDSMLRLWGHIFIRSISLVVIGLVLANADAADPNATGLPPGLWALLAVTGGILFWLKYPEKRFRFLKYAGLALLIVMLFLFRRQTKTGEAWLDFSYPEILGLIGRAYLAACILYVPFRKRPWAPAMWLVILTALNIATRTGMRSPEQFLSYWVWPFDSGELPSIVIAGIVASQIFTLATTFRTKALWASGYAAMLLAGGQAFAFLGISKNAATPAWCLYCSGIAVLLFLAIYWLADVKQWRAWAAFAKPAGSNTLLTYLLPDLYYFASLPIAFSLPWRNGWPGALRSLLFTACILGVSYLLTKRNIRMQL
jgi:heparan-alpha-glucosaminide N-acetyltransferase